MEWVRWQEEGGLRQVRASGVCCHGRLSGYRPTRRITPQTWIRSPFTRTLTNRLCCVSMNPVRMNNGLCLKDALEAFPFGCIA